MFRTNQEVVETMKEMGDRNVSTRLVEARQAGRYSSTGPGSFLVGSMAGKLGDALEAWADASLKPRRGVPGVMRMRIALAILQMGSEKVAAISCRYVVDSLCLGEQRRESMRHRLASILHDEARMGSLIKLDLPRIRYVQKYIKNINRSKATRLMNFIVDELDEEQREQVVCWEPKVATSLAMLILVFLVKTSGVLESHTYFSKTNKSSTKLRFKSETNDWIREAEEAARVVLPLNLPLVDPPNDWVSPVDGGYPEEFVGRRPLMSTRVNAQIKALHQSKCPEVYEAINHLQRVAWEVNPEVLEVFRTAVEEGWGEEGLKIPPKEDPPKPKADDAGERGTEKRRIWSREWKHYWMQMDAKQAESMRCARLITLADMYTGGPLYYVHMIDFRGRAYPLAASLQYQGDDRNRGLLRFHHGKPIDTQEAADWFNIHGANTWGVDKVSFEDRLVWVEENRQRIQDVYEDPISNRWWVDADKPWQFLAWCLEAGRFFEEGLGFVSRLPVGMDGSNNGLQLYSLLLRDEVGGRATNCLPCDAPRDIYQDVADATNAALKLKMRSEDADQRRWARQLFDYWPDGFPRKALKRPVMTLPYGSTRHSCQHYIADWYHGEVRGRRLDPAPFPDLDAHQAMTFFAEVAWEQINATVIKAMGAMEWIREVSNLATGEEKSLTWTTPTGLRVLQKYRKGKKKLITLALDKPVTYWYKDPTPRIDSLKERNGACPNYIHSLDAALMCRVTNSAVAQGVSSLMMIHDSFSTHAADAPALARIIREEAVKMFSNDLLMDFHQEVQEYLGVPVPPPPTKGTLDLNQLHDSKYFFA